MSTYRYFPPASEEQKAYAVLCGGTLLSVALIIVLSFVVHDDLIHIVLGGAAVALIYRLATASWQLEKKGLRARVANISVSEAGLEVTNLRGAVSMVPWADIQKVDVTGGKLAVTWTGGGLYVGAREIENGMNLTREILRHMPTPHKSSNFIDLQPR